MTRKLIRLCILITLLLSLSSCRSDFPSINETTQAPATDEETPAFDTEAQTTGEELTEESSESTATQSVPNENLFGKYIYEKDGCGGSFTIDIKSDGTFFYYEGGLSSHVGVGEWTLAGDVICIDDSSVYHEHKHYFKIEEDHLAFIEEESNNFIYVKVKDGERFFKRSEEQTN